MTDHTSDKNLESEEKSFIKEKMAAPTRGKAFYAKIVLAVIGGLLLFGIATGTSFALMMHHLGKEVSETQSEIDIPFERDTIPETVEASTETEDSTEAEVPEIQNEADADEKREALLGMLRELNGDSMLSELVNDSLYTAYENAACSLVTVRNSAGDAEAFYAESDTVETFGVIVAMSDYEAVVLFPSEPLNLEAPFQVQIQEYGVEAVLKQVDSLTGIAALTVNLRQLPDGIRGGLSAIGLGNSYNVKLGDRILLAGSPLGVTGSAIAGNVTYLKKEVHISDSVVRLIYTDIPAAYEGGGILLNARGELVGWITSKYSDSALGRWTAAVGISELKSVMEDLILGQDTASLGVLVRSISSSLAESLELPEGLYVTDVDSQSPAYEAGIQNGDVITAIEDVEMRSVRSLQNFLEDAEPGAEVTVKVMRLGRDAYKEVSFVVELGSR